MKLLVLNFTLMVHHDGTATDEEIIAGFTEDLQESPKEPDDFGVTQVEVEEARIIRSH